MIYLEQNKEREIFMKPEHAIYAYAQAEDIVRSEFPSLSDEDRRCETDLIWKYLIHSVEED